MGLFKKLFKSDNTRNIEKLEKIAKKVEDLSDKYRVMSDEDLKNTTNLLKERLANTTQKIVSNDIRKQQADEIKKQQVEPITFDSYTKEANTISAYFKNMRVKLKDLKPYHIEGFYKSQYEKGLSGNTVLHFHILIRECLQYAFKNDFVNVNVADKVTRPKTEGYKASFYSADEIEKLFQVIKEHECRLPIMLTAMYGFRRNKVIWKCNIEFL